VEASVDSLAVELTEGSVFNVNDVIRLLMLEKELAESANWETRRRAFRRHHKLDLRKCAKYDYLEGAIEVRNAIAHGLGKLTTRQTLSAQTPKQLRVVNVSVVNQRVDLNADHISECARHCAEFLLSLDSMLP